MNEPRGLNEVKDKQTCRKLATSQRKLKYNIQWKIMLQNGLRWKKQAQSVFATNAGTINSQATMTEQFQIKWLRRFRPLSRGLHWSSSESQSGEQTYIAIELPAQDSAEAPITKSSLPKDLKATPQPRLQSALTGTSPKSFQVLVFFRYTFSWFEEDSSE